MIYIYVSPLKLAPRGRTPAFLDIECGAWKKAYKVVGHQKFTLIQNGRAQSRPPGPEKQ